MDPPGASSRYVRYAHEMTNISHSGSLKDAWFQRLDACGDDTVAIESSLRDAQAVVRRHASRLNSLNTVAMLPSDILEIIYLCTQSLCHTFGDKVTAHWLSVTEVCHRWREVSSCNRHNWTRLMLAYRLH